jgi:hypothetical protein
MLPELPSCRDEVILQTLQQAGRDFCIMSEAWLESMTADITTGVVQYDLLAMKPISNYDVDIQRLVQVNVDNGIVYPDQYTLVDQQYLLFDQDQKITKVNGMVINVVLAPKYEALKLSTTLMNRYSRALMARAKHLLQIMPNVPWSNPALAAYNKQVADDEIATAVMDKYRTFLNWDMQLDLRRGIY